MSVIIETNLGDLTVDLYTKDRPKCCYNFIKLCKCKYYNYNLIFDVKKDFALRTGDPSNTGNGGESIYWKDKSKQVRKKYFSSEKLPIIKHDKRGLISMINNGNDQHGSQFLLTLGDNLKSLDKQGHSVFGIVVEGLDVLESFNKTMVDDSDRPYRDLCISHTVVLHDPYRDPDFALTYIDRRSPDIPGYLIDSERVGIYDDLEQDDHRPSSEIEAEREEKEAKEKAVLLEMIGDLPSADVKPPDNVLFVCKLNPITTDEDLERIFSRFGKINSVNVVRDQKTKESLQYAFIEYDNKDDCERAYSKMDNVLIDDRRIHVDFSQSVKHMRR